MDIQRLHAENHPEIFKIPHSDNFAVSFFDEMLLDQATRVFIAEENGQDLGYILCKLIERPENPFTFAMRYLLVGQISVRPAEQEKELKVSRIQLDSWEFNTEAHGFFEKMGFEKFNHRFWQNL